jgi:hypothetical protein
MPSPTPRTAPPCGKPPGDVYHAIAGGTTNDAIAAPMRAPVSIKISVVFTVSPHVRRHSQLADAPSTSRPSARVQPSCQGSVTGIRVAVKHCDVIAGGNWHWSDAAGYPVREGRRAEKGRACPDDVVLEAVSTSLRRRSRSTWYAVTGHHRRPGARSSRITFTKSQRPTSLSCRQPRAACCSSW